MKRWLIIAILAIVAQGSEARAQSKGDVELGFDGGVSMAIVKAGDKWETSTTVGFPFQSFRLGWFASDRFEIEPSVGLQWFSRRTEYDSTFYSPATSVLEEGGAGGVELALAYNGGGIDDAGRFFVKGGGMVLFAGDIESQLGVEAGVGWKQRLGSHWAFRVELSGGRTFENDSFAGAWLPSLAIGFSHFSKGR